MKQVAQLRAFGEKIEGFGASLVLIGNGTVEQACEYKQRESLPFRLLVDPKLVGYQAMELKRNLLAGFRPRSFFRLARALRAGFRGGPIEGDAYQLGGLFVIARDGEVWYDHVSHEPGDEPPIEDILESLRRIQAVGPAAEASHSRVHLDMDPDLLAEMRRPVRQVFCHG